MALLYRDGQYRDTETGEALTELDLAVLRDTQADLWAEELGMLAARELGIGEALAAVEFPAGRIDRFATRFLARVGEMVTSAYVWAAGGIERVTDAGWRTVADLVARQERFGQGFVADLREGSLSGAQASARAELYGGAAVEAFERGRGDQLGLELPAYPGDGGTPCLGRCRCVWTIEELPDRWEATWLAHDDASTCTGCKDREERWSPWVQRR